MTAFRWRNQGPEYLRGMNYLLDEESDRALEVFMRLAEVDKDTLETHFALGNLFRKRGEMDRAIRVHQNIMARPGLDKSHKAQAEFALAEDYMSAGLLDRAENSLSGLAPLSRLSTAGSQSAHAHLRADPRVGSRD